MMPSWKSHFGKITAWSLIYFFNYSISSYLAQSQILVISLYDTDYILSCIRMFSIFDKKFCKQFLNYHFFYLPAMYEKRPFLFRCLLPMLTCVCMSDTDCNVNTDIPYITFIIHYGISYSFSKY